jgi:hypothetical protein
MGSAHRNCSGRINKGSESVKKRYTLFDHLGESGLAELHFRCLLAKFFRRRQLRDFTAANLRSLALKMESEAQWVRQKADFLEADSKQLRTLASAMDLKAEAERFRTLTSSMAEHTKEFPSNPSSK